MRQLPVRPRKATPFVAAAERRPARPGRTWEAAVDAFVADGRRRNLSPATVDTYHSILTSPRTQEFRRDHGVRSPEDLSAEKVKAFEGELLEAGLSAGTVIGYHRVLLTFARYCIREGIAVDEKVLGVQGPKVPKHEPEIFSPDEEQRLHDACEDDRDRLIIEFMIRTGLRLEEVAHVRADDIVESPQGAYVRVRQGKGRKDRIVPLDTGNVKLSRKLQRYINDSRPRGSDERALFLSRRHRSGEAGQPLTARAIQVMLYRLGQVTGIHVHPHKFRHTFATRALAAGVDVMALQRALGHTTLAMVSRYVHYQKDDLLEAWQRRRD